MLEFPFTAETSVPQGSGGDEYHHLCSGGVIDPEWVITAAHCLDGGNIRSSFLAIRFDQSNASSGWGH